MPLVDQVVRNTEVRKKLGSKWNVSVKIRKGMYIRFWTCRGKMTAESLTKKNIM